MPTAVPLNIKESDLTEKLSKLKVVEESASIITIIPSEPSTESASTSARRCSAKIRNAVEMFEKRSSIEQRPLSSLSMTSNLSRSNSVSPRPRSFCSLTRTYSVSADDKRKSLSAMSVSSVKSDCSESTTNTVQMVTNPLKRSRWFEEIECPKERTILLTTMSRDARMRQEISHEILSTERDYIKDLEFVLDVYLKPMLERKILSKSKELTDIYSSILQILPVNKVFLAELENCKAGAMMNSVGEAFMRMADFFKLYTLYSPVYPRAIETLAKLYDSNSSYVKLLDEVRKRPDYCGMNLESYLMKPVQRICKYPLLLRELLKYTPASHQDHTSLQKANEKIQSIVAVINERSKHVETLVRTMEVIQKLAKGRQFHVPTRHFIQEFPVKVRFSNEKNNTRYMMVLFNDIMLFCTVPKLLSGDKYKVSFGIKLKDLFVIDYKINEQCAITVSSATTINLITFKQEQDKKSWLIHLQTLKDERMIRIEDSYAHGNITQIFFSPDRKQSTLSTSSTIAEDAFETAE